MSYDVWKTLYTGDFDSSKYLYHYTSMDKAIKIIHSNELRFSHIGRTNDTSESKLKIIYIHSTTKETLCMDERIEKVSKYFKEYHNIVRLLCFSMDSIIKEKEKKSPLYLHRCCSKDRYYDVSGRGFALPRMWAQYASNNEGVCFIINKSKLEEQINKRIEFCKHAKVQYKSYFDFYSVDENKLNSIYEKISMVANGGLSLINLIQNDKDFLKYNFLEKLHDWKNEHEYRYIALTDMPKSEISVNCLFNYLEGIVIGEKADPAYENVIKTLIESRCEIKKIYFDTNICKVKSLGTVK